MDHDDTADKVRSCCHAAAFCSGSNAQRELYEMALERDCDCGDAHAGLAQIYRQEYESWQQAATCCKQDGADPDLISHCEEQAAEAHAMYQYHGNKVRALLGLGC